jgi:hypothetical protein
MTYTATVRFSYTTDSQDSPSKYFPESVDRKTIIVEAPAEDLNIHQYYELFKSFLAASGFCEYSILDGACRVAFNDSNSEAQMKKVADEYELILAEDYHKKLIEYDADQDEELKKLEAEIRELKEKLGEVLPEQYKDWSGLVPGSEEAYEHGCKCPVLDNYEMPDDKKWVNGDCPLHGVLGKVIGVTPNELAQGLPKVPQDAL